MCYRPIAVAALISLSSALPPTLAQTAPKYGPNAVPLSKRTNSEYFKTHAASDFYSLIGFYVGQPTGRACSAAALTLLINAARAPMDLRSDEKQFTVETFSKDVGGPAYEEAVLGKGKRDRSQVTNLAMTALLNRAAEQLKFKTEKTLATLYDVDDKNPENSKAEFVKLLKSSEADPNDFILITFIQGILTGDPEGGPHVAIIGAYDEKKGLALILDPDREWYEPYWAPVDKVFEAVKDPRADGRHPGWVHFRVR